MTLYVWTFYLPKYPGKKKRSWFPQKYWGEQLVAPCIFVPACSLWGQLNRMMCFLAIIFGTQPCYLITLDSDWKLMPWRCRVSAGNVGGSSFLSLHATHDYRNFHSLFKCPCLFQANFKIPSYFQCVYLTLYVLGGGCDSFWLLHRKLDSSEYTWTQVWYTVHTWSTPFVRRVLVVQPGTPLRSWLRELFPHPPPALPAHCHDCPACSCHWCWLTLKNIMKNFGFEQYSNIHQQVDFEAHLLHANSKYLESVIPKS